MHAPSTPSPTPPPTLGGGAPAAAPPFASAVAEDLESIFPTPATTPPEKRLRLRGRRRGGAPASGARGESKAAAIGAVVAALAVGVSAGALVSRPWERAEAPRAEPARAGAALPLVIGPIDPRPAPLAAASMAVLPTGVDPATVARPAETPRLRRAAAAKHRAQPSLQRVSAVCGARRRCGHAALMDADAGLRHAYHQAVRAGVPNEVLIVYRDQWASLRRKSQRDPARTVAGYRRLQGELSGLALQHRVSDRPRRHGGFGRLGAEIAALWP